MRWEAWPALLAALGWAVFLAALVAVVPPAATATWLALLVLVGMPIAVSAGTLIADWRKAEWDGLYPHDSVPVPSSWPARLVLGGAIVLLLGGMAFDLLIRPSAFDVRRFDDNLPLTVSRLLPGLGDTWAYIVAIGLTLSVVAGRTPGRMRSLVGPVVSLAAATVLGGLLLALDVEARGQVAGAAGEPTSCQRPAIGIGVPGRFGGEVISHADGEVDGQPIGTADLRSSTGGIDQGVTLVLASSANQRTITFDGSSTPLSYQDQFRLADLWLWVFHGDRTITADDRGLDLVGGVPVRHCTAVADGRSALFSFASLRWLIGVQGRDDPGAGLEAWRGTIEYWIDPVAKEFGEETGYSGLTLASVGIDGPAQDWPVTGLRARLRAWIWFPPPAG